MVDRGKLSQAAVTSKPVKSRIIAAMSFNSSTVETAEHLANLRRLIQSRWLVLGSMALAAAVAPGLFDIPLMQLPLFAIVGCALLINATVYWRLRTARTASAIELFSQLVIDIVVLGGLVFFTGGATNPLVSLLLPTVAIAALTLPGRLVVVIAGLAVLAYSLLMRFYIALPIPDAGRATHLHLIGMWLIFAVSAAMIAWLIVRMTGLIRQRDSELAAAREQALRDERVTAMGTLAAGAAHELGTPLATMALLAGELANDTTLSDGAREDVALLRQQLAVCKEIITGLAQRAGADRLDNPALRPADRWLKEIRQHWHAVRPRAGSRFIVGTDGEAPMIVADPRLEQAVLNLLNNAANASSLPLDIRLSWCSFNLCIDIRDHGPGFPPEILAIAGHTGIPAHDQGSGVGLVLTRSAIEQLGGQLTLSNPDDGGALARIELPLQSHEFTHPGH